MDLKYKVFSEKTDISPLLEYVSNKRVEYFSKYPYLYKGNKEYEYNYMQDFYSIEGSVFIGAYLKNELIAFLTGCPLKEEVQITKDVYRNLLQENYNPTLMFYISEVIVNKDFQRQGILRNLFLKGERYIVDNKFQEACFLTVQREDNDTRKPSNYKSPDTTFKKYGYTETDTIIYFEWPTYISNQDVKNIKNPMKLWRKKLSI